MNARRKSHALGLPVILLVLACFRESSHKQHITTSTNISLSTAPARHVEKRDNVLVRFVNSITNGKSVDLFADLMSTFANVAYTIIMSYWGFSAALLLPAFVRLAGKQCMLIAPA